jgi:hypothetical protein
MSAMGGSIIHFPISENFNPPLAAGPIQRKLRYAQRTSTEEIGLEHRTRIGATLASIEAEEHPTAGAFEGAWTASLAGCEAGVI